MVYFVAIGGVVASFFLIKYRERVGDMLGESDWAMKVGGIYNVVIIIAIFIFFWSLATLTGTTRILFAPILWFIPGFDKSEPPTF